MRRRAPTTRRAPTAWTRWSRACSRTALQPGSNVYAELGSTWRLCMRDPDTAAHTLGKLIKHCGESNVLWGTDSIWYGSPQDQIQAFRTFQIAPELRERHGYAEMTPALRAKIFGLNALRIYPVPAGRAEGSPAQRPGGAPARRVPAAAGPVVRHLRAEDAPRVPEPAGLGRGLRHRWTNHLGCPLPEMILTARAMFPRRRRVSPT